jgi:hypothetical protein
LIATGAPGDICGVLAIGGDVMGATRIAAIILIVLGALALVYNGFTYTTKDTAAKAGPLELKVENEHSVYVPVWAGVGALVVGGLLLLGVARTR